MTKRLGISFTKSYCFLQAFIFLIVNKNFDQVGFAAVDKNDALLHANVHRR